MKDMRVEYISTLELARQIALVDHKLYRAIKIGEVLYMNWTKEKTKHEKSANVLKMINQFNRIGQWVISSLVTTQNDDKRCKLLQKFISVANESFKLRNLNGAMAIISGLKNSNIARLKRTWVFLSFLFCTFFNSLELMVNWKKIRMPCLLVAGMNGRKSMESLFWMIILPLCERFFKNLPLPLFLTLECSISSSILFLASLLILSLIPFLPGT